MTPRKSPEPATKPATETESDDADGRRPLKDKVIHARVSETMEDALRKRAGSLGLSVSHLVRNILHNAFDLVEDIVADSASIARSVGGGVPKPRQEQREEVLGWQEAVLNLNAVCESCNTVLPKGSQAAIGVGGPRTFLCLACLKTLPATAKEA